MVTEEEVIQLVRREMTKISRVRLVYTLRDSNLRVFTRSLDYILCVVALANLGLPINSYTVSTTLKLDPSSAINVLHGLGDKGILTLKRKNEKKYQWIIQPWFHDKIIGGKSDKNESLCSS
jgi:hypothetical protein